MSERCEAEITNGWHQARCSRPARHMRETLAVCGIHDRKRSVRPFTGCNCAIHAPAPQQPMSEESGER